MCRSILRRAPGNPRALHLLGMLDFQNGRVDDAFSLLQRAAAVDPASAVVRSDLGAVLGLSGRIAEAIAVLREAVALSPSWPEAHNNLGVALENARQYESACDAYRQAIQLRPQYVDARNHLGNSLRLLARPSEAVVEHELALSLNPNSAAAYRGLAHVFSDLGKPQAAAISYRKAVDLRPDLPGWHSDLLFALHHVPEVSPRRLFQEHLAWANRHGSATYPPLAPREVDADPDRRIRIGYVSPDFRSHPTSLMMEPLLAHHDKVQFDIFCN